MRFQESAMRVIGRTGHGRAGPSSCGEDDEVDRHVRACSEVLQVLAITENGYGKRTRDGRNTACRAAAARASRP